MNTPSSSLNFDLLRSEILLKTGQTVSLDDPLMAAILVIDHSVRANLIAAKEAAQTCRLLVEQSVKAATQITLNEPVEQQFKAVRDDVAKALQAGLGSNKTKDELRALYREIQKLEDKIDVMGGSDGLVAEVQKLATVTTKLERVNMSAAKSACQDRLTITDVQACLSGVLRPLESKLVEILNMSLEKTTLRRHVLERRNALYAQIAAATSTVTLICLISSAWILHTANTGAPVLPPDALTHPTNNGETIVLQHPKVVHASEKSKR